MSNALTMSEAATACIRHADLCDAVWAELTRFGHTLTGTYGEFGWSARGMGWNQFAKLTGARGRFSRRWVTEASVLVAAYRVLRRLPGLTDAQRGQCAEAVADQYAAEMVTRFAN